MARVFLSTDAVFTLGDGAEVAGRGDGGREGLIVQPDVAGVTADANVERIDLPVALGALTLRAGDQGLSVSADGRTIVTIPSLNQPLDLRGTDGGVTVDQTGAQRFTLSGTDGTGRTVGTSPVTPSVSPDPARASAAGPGAVGGAADGDGGTDTVFLDGGETFTLADDAEVLGTAEGAETLALWPGVGDVATGANIHRVDLAGDVATAAFRSG